MLLSSLRRLRLYCTGQGDTLLTNNVQNNRILHNWLSSVSYDIESFLNRSIHIESRIEYFDIDKGRTQFWVKGFPVTTLTDVYEDSEGLWDGDETEIDDIVNFASDGRIVLPYTLPYSAPNALRIRYTGGIAYDAVQSVITLNDGADTFVVDKYVVGSTSGAVGIVVSYSSLSLTVEQYYGQFISGETIQQYDDEAETASDPSVTGVISEFSQESLLNQYPNICIACEAQIRYMRQHQMDFENSGTTKDGVTIRKSTPFRMKYPLQEEVLNMIYSYKRIR